ncbi:uncharacterized protein CC84DRAFT_1150375 [Paraphaeosphaeria sporulosa]|uniref:Calponin-homology (CH) domain-containing protein n=1 Tax=Paraphaeosphaeria sporulosa TaxID=1460663 RepID=A0A177C6Y6_9PLEO|nr:uncharacterized protein CC84DRAFT_1150375 [Paraphaeosphaeria sporulosa]OAG02507.1 hypothetical protein CC84DRAFT_1150375 [Paraphaeosphaeria sporulosa]
MRRFAESTPCPAPHLFASHRDAHDSRRTSMYAPAYSTDGDTTANIEYTTELKASLRNAKPRRPARSMRQSTFNPSLDIFEDVAQEEQAALETKRRSRASVMPPGVDKKSSILAHKPQRIHIPAPPVSEAPPQRPQRRRVSQLLVDRHEAPDGNATAQLQEVALDQRELRKQGPRKDPRRRTIYVPSDDTTMFTIHPGQPTRKPRNPREHSPDTGLELVTLSEEEAENLVSALKQDKVPRKSLAAPPKRAPLLQTARQSQSFSHDVQGQGGGKENVPPGMQVFEGKAGTHIEFNFAKEDQKKPAPKPSRVHFTSKTSEASSQTRTKTEGTQKRLRPQFSQEASPAKSIKAKADSVASSVRTISSRTSTTTRSSVKTVKSRASSRPSTALSSSSPFHTDRSPPTALRRRKMERGPVTITMMHEVGRRAPPKEKYPVLTEDLARPELYEDNWLTYQEIAITQLINSMFDSASKDPNAEQSAEQLRQKLLDMYHEPSMPSLHKRLQASLQYGALSIPKDLLAQTLRLKDDVGLRKKFLNLWVKSYDLTSLRAAAETIIGRQLNVPSRLSSGSTSSDDGSRLMRAERRAIENFLDAFLIRNEDAVRVKSGMGSIASIARSDLGDDFGSQAWSWRRTALRSLMLVYLLDKAKNANLLSGCLFQSTSTYKTSTDVLHALASLLLPSHGDITRPLGHLNYKVSHVQYPLQEYTYHIDNIAIDLRDGVVLTRLVELLIYPPPTLTAQREDTVTITMPTGDVLTSAVDFTSKESWVLSQHLKFPSIGRAQKLYNVQVALAALDGVRGLPIQVVGGMTPEDIVDGHRERTLSLLWSLIGKHGLGTLVNWTQLTKEIERFRDAWYSRRDNYGQRDLDSEDDEPTSELTGLEHHKRLLLSWARCAARTYGLRVTNLTTSFSNPKVLEAIVDTYLPCTLLDTTPSSSLSLAAKLEAIGCSTSFIALFASPKTSILSKDFTLLTLSFLASRLLPLNVTHRAASTIQRVYRARLARRALHQRIVKAQIAHEAAVVAQARERLLGAAMLVQRRWRAVLDGRKKDLEAHAVLFQSLARGWAIRRWARRVTGGKVGGKEKVRRVRGGW